MVVSNGNRTIAVEVLDNEGLFNVYIERIRQQVAADGYRLDGIFISSTHDKSAPDTIGLYGVTPVTSSANPYFADYLVQRSAKAIEQAYDAMRPARVRYAEAIQPANLRQCWSSYPYTDNQLMPTLQTSIGTSKPRASITIPSCASFVSTMSLPEMNVREATTSAASVVDRTRSGRIPLPSMSRLRAHTSRPPSANLVSVSAPNPERT